MKMRRSLAPPAVGAKVSLSVTSTRLLTASELRWLPDEQKAYLQVHKSDFCLQPDAMPVTALYQTMRHGAVTIERAIELDALYDAFNAREAAKRVICERRPTQASDKWERRDLACIEQHGCSTVLW